MRKPALSALALGLFLLFAPSLAEAGGAPEGASLYEDPSGSFRLTYPSGLTIRDISGAFVLKGMGGEWMGELKEAASYPRAELEGRIHTWEDFALYTAKLSCDADGPDGSRSCPEVLPGVKSLQSASGGPLQVVEFTLLEVVESRTASGTTVRRSRKGPCFAVRLSRPGEPHRILLFMPWGDEPPPPEASQAMREVASGVRSAPFPPAR